MTTPRWTEQAEEQLITMLDEAHAQRTTWREYVQAALGYLADAGLLLPNEIFHGQSQPHPGVRVLY